MQRFRACVDGARNTEEEMAGWFPFTNEGTMDPKKTSSSSPQVSDSGGFSSL